MILYSSIAEAQESIDIYRNSGNQLLAKVVIQTGYTMYGLAHTSGKTISEIMDSNPELTGTLSIGDQIELPLSTQKVLSSTKEVYNPIPLMYRVQNGENLFQISRVLNASIDSIKRLNNIEEDIIVEGQTLHVGWINWPYQPEHYVVVHKNEPQKLIQSDSASQTVFTVQDSSTFVSMDVISKTSIQPITEKGIAFWQRTTSEYNGLIAMHPKARVNSYISLYNPMLKRKVKAKVVGELPKEVYPKDVSVVISSSVANALGALDRRFLVEITYTE